MKPKLYKLLAVLLGAATLCGCPQGVDVARQYLELFSPAGEEAPSQPPMENIRVPVDTGDTLNPYLLKTRLNQCVSTLLYDPLVKLTPEFLPQYCLAQEITLSGALCTVRVRDDVSFSDGSPLNAGDVAYSMQLCFAGDLGRRYGNVLSYRLADAQTVEITLARPDIYFVNLLTFPIVKNASGAQELPPGTGRYRLVDKTHLVKNENHFENTSTIKTIELSPVRESKELSYRLISNQLDFALLDPAGTQTEAAGSFPVQTNNMLYLGFNTTLPPGDNAAFRQGVGLLLDREGLVREVYEGRALASARPVNPLFLPPGEPEAGPLPQQAAALLESAGLTREEGGFYSREGRVLDLQLAVNMENPARRAAAGRIKAQLESGGLKVTINDYSFEQYKQQVAMGGYSLYLGETRLPEDMDLTALLAPGGALHYHLGDTAALYEGYLAARRGETPYEAFLADFSAQSPFLPLLFPQNVISHSRNFYAGVVATEQDIFYNIHKW